MLYNYPDSNLVVHVMIVGVNRTYRKYIRSLRVCEILLIVINNYFSLVEKHSNNAVDL